MRGELISASLGGIGWGDENAPASVWSVRGDVGGGGAGEDVSPTLRRVAGGEAFAGLAGELVSLFPSWVLLAPEYVNMYY